jgi:predicted TIM-barrel fold metal-dependent hydrolase
MIIDADGHLVEALSLWKDFVPEKYRDRIYVEYRPDGLMGRIVIGDWAYHGVDDTDNAKTGLPGFTHGDGQHPGGFREWPPQGRPFEGAEPGGWNPKIRLEVHDREGIDAAVLFPTVALVLGHLRDVELSAVACEAVNRWASSFCSAAPDEFFPVAILPAGDPELAAKELRRAVNDGHVAGLIRPNPHPNGRLIDDPAYEVLWSTAEDLDVAMCVHNVGDGKAGENAGVERQPGFFLRHAAAHPFEAMLAYGAMFKARVFDRHPNLRVGYMEAACGWLPFWLERLDEHTEVVAGQFDPPLQRLPSEVFREQCVVGCEGDEKMVPYVQREVGLDKVLWASDFPHFDSELPLIKRIMERRDLSNEQRDAVMRGAAVRFYRLDEEAIERSNARRRSQQPLAGLKG